MVIKTIRRLEDTEGLHKGDFLEIKMNVQVQKEKIKLTSTRIFEERTKTGFDVIGPIITNMGPPVAKIHYYWDPQNNTLLDGEHSFPFVRDSPEYKQYEALLNKLDAELALAGL